MMRPSPEPICVLVVDDEAPAREHLADLLVRDRDIGLILQAEDGLEAVALIQEERPDLVFLDVQMPGVDGLGVIEALGAGNMPVTVFVTAYDRFAVQAFGADTTDYLLKPFNADRFIRTMERVRMRLRELRAGEETDPNSFGPELLELASRRFKPGEFWQWLAVTSQGRTHLVTAEEIDWIEADGAHVILHAGSDNLRYAADLAEVASHLDPLQFVRIHQSALVNLSSVALLKSRLRGELGVLMKNGERLTLNRAYRADVERVLGQSL
jgi:two-component system LytT family response regulator